MTSLIDQFRVLLVDDEPAIHDVAQQQLHDLTFSGQVDLLHAVDEVEALDVVRQRYVDLIILDLQGLDGSLSGYEVLADLHVNGVSSDVVLVTHLDLGSRANALLSLISRSRHPRVTDFIDKNDNDNWAFDAVDSSLDRFRQRAVEVEGIDIALEVLRPRRDRYRKLRGLPLRSDDSEVAVEIERLCRCLFGHVIGEHRASSIHVQLDRLARRGLSSAITLKATVHLKVDRMPTRTSGYECVLKIGPRQDLLAEAARYEEFVRYGVPLEQRVELLSHAEADSLGGITYSFAGGLFGDDLVSLDELLRSDHLLALSVIRDLFQTKQWYAVDAGVDSPRKYLHDAYGTSFSKAYERNVRSLRNISRKLSAQLTLDDHGPGTFRIPGAPKLIVPEKGVVGEGAIMRSRKWCLVHGDMHGGNVMAELSDTGDRDEVESRSVRRVCTIDYRNAGPGPRCIDAAALECTVRLADADAIVRRISDKGEAGLSESQMREAAIEAARRLDTDTQVYRAAWRDESKSSSSDWTTAAHEVLAGLRRSFDDVSLEEYLQTAFLYGLRQLQYALLPIARVRILAWVSALYSLYRESNPSTGSRA